MNLQFFLNRLREPSTMAGIAALAYIFGADPEKIQSVTGAVTAIAGAAAIFMPEQKKE
jgi:hypothetical protein